MELSIITCEILILEPFDPATTIALKLLKSDKLFWAEEPVLSRASFKILHRNTDCNKTTSWKKKA